MPGQGGRGASEGKNGGSVTLLENKLHPFSLFIREAPEQSSTRPGVCESNGDVSFLAFFFFIFVFVLFSLKKFYFVVYFTFLVTQTKLRTRTAGFQADSLLEGSRGLAW